MNLPHSVEELINWMDSFNDKPKSFRKPERKNASTVYLQLKGHYLELFLNHALDQLMSSDELVRPEDPTVFFGALNSRLNVFTPEDVKNLERKVNKAEDGTLLLGDLNDVFTPRRAHDFEDVLDYLLAYEIADRCSGLELLNLFAISISYGKVLSLMSETLCESSPGNSIQSSFACSSTERSMIEEWDCSAILDWNSILELHETGKEDVVELSELTMSSVFSDTPKSSKRELTIAETVMAMWLIMKEANLLQSDLTAQARFISALTGYGYDNIYKRLRKPFKGDAVVADKRKKNLLVLFSEIKSEALIP